MDAILAHTDSNVQQEKLAREIYTIAIDFLDDIAATYDGWMGPNSKLVVLGGLMINVDGPQPDVFEPIMFEARNKNGVKTNLMPLAFNKKIPVSWTATLPMPVFQKHVKIDSAWRKRLTPQQA
jgi:hypothetical protein